MDTHTDNFEGASRQAAVMDQALTALLSDHQAKELLAQTLVVMGTECDRNVHMDAGRGGDLG